MKAEAKYANELRKQIGIPFNQPVDLNNVCRLNKIHLIYKPFGSDSFSGISLKKDSEKFLLVNSSKTQGHQNFTIAHELYHLLYDTTYDRYVCYPGQLEYNEKSIERKAEIFAINFLLPDEGVLHYLKKGKDNIKNPSLEKIALLESIFKVSHQATLIKLLEMKIITEKYKEEITPGITKVALEYGFDTELYEPTNKTQVVSPYISYVKEAYEQNLISEGKFRELLRKIELDLNEIFDDDNEQNEVEESLKNHNPIL
jgi:Zn-dependent peptidase ImmA (M78 family)